MAASCWDQDDDENSWTGVPSNPLDIKSFFIAPAVGETEKEQVNLHLHPALDKVLKRMETGGKKAYAEYKVQLEEEKKRKRLRKKQFERGENDNDDEEEEEEEEEDPSSPSANTSSKADLSQEEKDMATLEGRVPRSYQAALLERAKQENVIIHLGTGTGKTLIALLLIKHFATTMQSHQQTVFLVPSVALAVQQNQTLRSSLSLTIGVACAAQVQSEAMRVKLSKKQVLVATHGAYQDLLQHCKQLFSLDRVNLLILDECHNCTGNASYAVIMKEFHHRLPKEQRPHVLGLTASPLINVKMHDGYKHLADELMKLETTMDAKIVSVDHLNLSPTDDGHQFLNRQIDERVIAYPPPVNIKSLLPPFDEQQLHYSRIRELKQLLLLGTELGPNVLSMYTSLVVREVSRNEYEGETAAQFTYLKSYMNELAAASEEIARQDQDNKGLSNKLQQLERLLEYEIEQAAAHSAESNLDTGVSVSTTTPNVGVVFVQRRITALALQVYFQRRLESLEAAQDQVEANRGGLQDQIGVSRGGLQDQIGVGRGEQQDQVGVNRGELQVQPEVDRGETTCSDATPTRSSNAKRDRQKFESDSEDDQFMDAYEDEGFCFKWPTAPRTKSAEKNHCAMDVVVDNNEDLNQFDDADSDEDPFNVTMTDKQEEPPAPRSPSPPSIVRQATSPPPAQLQQKHAGERIRCRALVRNASKVFKSLSVGRQVLSDEELKKSWLHQEADIRKVINELRRGDINTLIATSVVEEGVDVQACSFVVMFDRLVSIKGYIQMKGRARDKHAKLYAFQGQEEGKTLSLLDAGSIESRVRDFIAQERHRDALPTAETLNLHNNEEAEIDTAGLSTELLAVKRGRFEREYGTVTLQTAKSLLYRYALNQPIDSAVRASQEALQAHLPLFFEDSCKLLLPAHIGRSRGERMVLLPAQYRNYKRKERQSILALMACVRLYEYKQLTDRLLPLSRKDIRDRIVELMTSSEETSTTGQVTSELTDQATAPEQMILDQGPTVQLFLYIIHQTSDKMDQARTVLNSEGRRLAVASLRPFRDVQNFSYVHAHAEFGRVGCRLEAIGAVECTTDAWKRLSKFFELVTNARWKRRTKKSLFQCREVFEKGHFPYAVGCVDKKKDLDWDLMERVIAESQRNRDERLLAVKSVSDIADLPAPRLWLPLYDELAVYIAHGPSNQTASDLFPAPQGEKEIRTYADFYRVRKSYSVSSDARLFHVQRLWQLPSRQHEDEGEQMSSSGENDSMNGRRFCKALRMALLPKEACIEMPFADCGLFLESLLLPQVLYQLERRETALEFVEYCQSSIPTLGLQLARLPVCDVEGLLSTKSCATKDNYERLEWVGDAVLKLVQTDAVLKSHVLNEWIHNMHEGDLDSVRSVMCSNDRLKCACERLGLQRFILSQSLSRGSWAPSPLELVNDSKLPRLGDKALADVVEAILGIVYLNWGYEIAQTVADEMNLLVPWDKTSDVAVPSNDDEKSRVSKRLLTVASSFTGHKRFRVPELVVEALTHPTSVNPNASSYQRLEWVGDAVLCLAARQWIYESFPAMEVGEMVLMETPLESNQSLAFISLSGGLHLHLDYGDQSLPGRIESYEWNVREMNRGMWGTDPPKVLADVVESLLGAVHLDAGFQPGQNAALHVLGPLLELYQAKNSKSLASYPKRQLLELGAAIMSVTTCSEVEFAHNFPTTPMWTGRSWSHATKEGVRTVATVGCLGMHLLSVADMSASSAINRASAFIVDCLENDPQFTNRFLNARRQVLSTKAVESE